jgi:hypothetical protein
MKRLFFNVFVATTLALMSCSQHQEASSESEAFPPITDEKMVARGKYLVTIAGCNDCHSPKIMTDHGPQPDPARLLSGHPMNDKLPTVEKNPDWLLFSADLTAFVGPWGISYAANLTPDDTGIGNWRYEQFETAIKKGKYKGLEGSRQLLPPMPWEMYRNMTDEDLHAVFAYLKSLPPVSNLVPAPVSPDKLLSKN